MIWRWISTSKVLVPNTSLSLKRLKAGTAKGTNQCVPTATANSLSYLYAKANMQPPVDDKFNKKLQEELAKAMKTTKKHGTRRIR